MSIFQGKLLTKSPYYIHETGVPGFTSIMEIRIWNGDSTNEPASPVYTISKQTLNSTRTELVMEIGKIIESAFNHKADIYNESGVLKTDSYWVNVKTFGGTSNRDDTWLALDGYGEFLEGLNYNPTNVSLITESILYHYDNIPLRLPVYCDGDDNACFVVYKKNGVAITTIDISLFRTSLNSYDKIQYTSDISSLPGSYDSVEIQDLSTNVIKTLKVVPVDCTKYTPHVVSFINRFGVNQEIVFSLLSKKGVSVNKESFNKQLLNTNGGVSYDTTKHQTKEYNTDARESITLNTNHIDESLNDTIAQLLQSEYVWVTVGGVISPVNVGTTSLDYKTSINDGLVNYTIDFDYSFSKRSNIY